MLGSETGASAFSVFVAKLNKPVVVPTKLGEDELLVKRTKPRTCWIKHPPVWGVVQADNVKLGLLEIEQGITPRRLIKNGSE